MIVPETLRILSTATSHNVRPIADVRLLEQLALFLRKIRNCRDCDEKIENPVIA